MAEQFGAMSTLELAPEMLESLPSPRAAQSTVFSKTVLGQSLCATGAGIFQVYSGGIAIDTVSTRMQAGATPRQAFFGQSAPSLSALYRANLFAGHQVTAQGRFPYLFTNLNTAAAANRAADANGIRGIYAQLFCIGCSTAVASVVITGIECPKIMMQLDGVKPGEKRPTILSVAREHGVARLLRGYDACVCREALFNTALLGSPAIAKAVNDLVLTPAAETVRKRQANGGAHQFGDSVVSFIESQCMLVTSFFMGLLVGFVTNGPDQLKTRIQHGQFPNLLGALRWQVSHGGGLAALYGPAAVYRAFYTGHGVVSERERHS